MRFSIGLLVLGGLARATATEPVTEFTLDEHSVARVPISLSRVTTFAFPGPISAIDAAGMTLDGSTPGCFQMAFQPTNFFFSLRALTNGASANINVVFKRKVYVLEVAEAATPVLSVIFREPPAPIPVSVTGGAPQGPRLNPSQLAALITKAKNSHMLSRFYPALLAGTTNVLVNLTTEYDAFRICTTSVTRFDAEDALAFQILLYSKTGKEIKYRPESLAVRVGSNIYWAAISDAGGTISPVSPEAVTFVIVGTADGQRNDLSPRNNFSVLLNLAPGS